jgi:short-subunit dehydrogenase
VIARPAACVPPHVMDVTDRTALVTGANRGIGRAITEALARKPMALVLAGMRDPDAFEPVPGARAEVRPVALDLSTRDSIDAGLAGLPPVDLLVNNAGRMTGGLLEEQDLDEVEAMFQVNLLALVQVTMRLLPGMLERGRGAIVNNASISGYAAFPGATTYAAAKHGVVGFSESLRRELKGTGVSVLHLVTPGVRTAMGDATADTYGRYFDTSGWDWVEPEDWAAKVVKAVEDDAAVLDPPAKLRVAKVLSRGPAAGLDALSARLFSRTPRT